MKPQIFERKDDQEKTLLNQIEKLLNEKCNMITCDITGTLNEINSKLDVIIRKLKEMPRLKCYGVDPNEVTTPWILLSPREKVVLEHIVTGKTNKEIAKEIYLSEGGVKNIVTKLLQKFQAEDRTQLAVSALIHNVIKEEKLSAYDGTSDDNNHDK